MDTAQERQNSLSAKQSYCSTLQSVELFESVRDAPPLHYRFKVESFSKLCEALKRHEIDHFVSSEFDAGGYQWKLCIYPGGNKTENGDGHISLYLILVEQLTSDKVIHATIKFFIYDHLHDVYLTIQGTKVRTFDVMNTQFGIPKLMEVTTFKDPANGFLFNDYCIFGVEVLVPFQRRKIMSSLSPVKELSDTNNTYVWKVDKFSELKDDSISSPVFSLGGHEWILRMHPNGTEGFKGKSLSLFLRPARTSEKKLFVEFELCLKDATICCRHCKKTTSTWFSETVQGWGYSDMVSLVDLNNPFNGYKKNDTATMEVRILVIFSLNDM